VQEILDDLERNLVVVRTEQRDCLQDVMRELSTETEINNETKSGGGHVATWDGRNDSGITVASGFYFLRLETGGQVTIRKIALLKCIRKTPQ